MIVWGRANSINVQKVLWLADELGIAFDRREAGGGFGFPQGYEAMNPHLRVPTIAWQGTVVWESNTILRFLAAVHEAHGFYPTDPVARAGIESWMDWQSASLAAAMRGVFFPLVRGEGTADDAATDLLAAEMGKLEVRLGSQANLLGDALTLADIALGPFAHRWLALPISRPDTPHLRRWHADLVHRPGYRAHVALPLS